MKPFVIITACNAKYGDFLTQHWFKSVLQHTDRELVDIAVLDYGLTARQKKLITAEKAIVVPCVANGHIVNIRYRDMYQFLLKNPYTQVLACDGGDMIFQVNITHLFREHTQEFRCVVEGYLAPQMLMLMRNHPVTKETASEVIRNASTRPMINGGLVIAPRKKFLQLCTYIQKHVIDLAMFGPDQFLLNVYLVKKGFFDLGYRYNFLPTMFKERFSIKEGVFIDKRKKPIAIVHNASGSYDFFRVIRDFGFGKNRNKIRYLPLTISRIVNPITTLITASVSSIFSLNASKQTTRAVQKAK